MVAEQQCAERTIVRKATNTGLTRNECKRANALRHTKTTWSLRDTEPNAQRHTKPTIDMLTPTGKTKSPHSTPLETDNAQAGMLIGRASPQDSAGETNPNMTSGQRRKTKPFATQGVGRRTPNDPRRRATPGPRRMPPVPQDVLQGRAPRGESRTPGPCRGPGRALGGSARPERRAKGPRGNRKRPGAEQHGDEAAAPDVR